MYFEEEKSEVCSLIIEEVSCSCWKNKKTLSN